ncbi:MAG: SRPBCC domain-containing protein [Candidatus Acidiferrales bacterium]
MTKSIQQSARFPVSPRQLFETYLDSKKHSAATGGLAQISRKVGGKFKAWHGQLWGHNLLIVPNRMIVQAWRSVNFKASDPDSILILRFSKVPGGGRIDLVHANVPPQDHAGVTKGWHIYYWKPWKEYFAGRKRG